MSDNPWRSRYSLAFLLTQIHMATRHPETKHVSGNELQSFKAGHHHAEIW